MDSIISFLRDADLQSLAADPRALALAGITLVLAVVFRWKSVLVVLLAVGGTLAVMRYGRIDETSGPFDQNLVIFIGGSVVVGVVLIYLVFIRGD